MHRQVNWDGHFSAEGEKRELPHLRVIISQFQGQPGIIGLHGGLPAASAFPITSLSFTLRDGTTATIDDPTKVCCCVETCAQSCKSPRTIRGMRHRLHRLCRASRLLYLTRKLQHKQ